MSNFKDISFFGTFSETQVGDSDKTTTSVADIAQPEPKTALTNTEGLTTSVVSTGGESSQPEGLQVSGETAVVIVEVTAFSIADMIEKLFQVGGLEIPMIEAIGVSTSAEDMTEGPLEPEDSHERLTSLIS